MGLEAKTSPDVDRGSFDRRNRRGDVDRRVFSTSRWAISWDRSTVENQRVVAKIVSKTEPDPAGMAAQMTAIRNELKQKLARERNQIFEDGVRQTLEKEGKIKIHQDVIDRICCGLKRS